MSVSALENVGIVVADIDEVTRFFRDLGLDVVGEADVSGDWVDAVLGLDGVRSRVVMLQTPDGHGRLELVQYASPRALAGDRGAPPHTLGIRRVAFAVDDVDAAVARLGERGVELVGEVVRYEDAYRICYVRGPEGIIVMLSQSLTGPS